MAPLTATPRTGLNQKTRTITLDAINLTSASQEHKSEKDFETMRRMEEEYEHNNPAFFVKVLKTEGKMELRLHAVCALADVGNESAVPILSEVLKKDPDPLLRHEAAFSLGQMGLKSGTPALIEAMLKDQSDVVRHEAAAAIGSIGDPSARKALEQALQDPSPLVTGSAKASLYNLDYLRQHALQIENTDTRNVIRP